MRAVFFIILYWSFLLLLGCNPNKEKTLIDEKLPFRPNIWRNSDFFLQKDSGFVLNLRKENFNVIKFYSDSVNSFSNRLTLEYNEFESLKPKGIHRITCMYSNQSHSLLRVYGPMHEPYDTIYAINNTTGKIINKIKLPLLRENILIYKKHYLFSNNDSIWLINYLNNEVLWSAPINTKIDNKFRCHYIGKNGEKTIYFAELNEKQLHITDISMKDGLSSWSIKYLFDSSYVSEFIESKAFWVNNQIGFLFEEDLWLQIDTSGKILWKNYIGDDVERVYNFERVFITSDFGDFKAISKKEGRVLWERDMFGAEATVKNRRLFISHEKKLVEINVTTGEQINSWEFKHPINWIRFYKNFLIYFSEGNVYYKDFSKYLN